jgi:uncharacterized protein (TIGR02266 family)
VPPLEVRTLSRQDHRRVLTGDPSLPQASRPARIEPESVPVFSVNRARTLVPEVSSRLLGVVPRAAPRLPIHLDVQLREGRAVVTGQSEDLSRGGMLVRAEGSFALGTKVRFEIQIPGDPTPVRGEALVVHRTVVGNQRVPGLGLRFLACKSNGLERLRLFVGREGSSR